ncbi:hypothetical protein JTB14_002220 [Gonioctena quinquepunctata]|nr:hypothetical protein JTB14_002220 [Gonioctena quinquepunctata]
MSRGIAAVFSKKFGQLQTLREQNPEVGGVLQLKKGQRNIYYLVTKRHSQDKPSYEDVWKSLTKLRDTMVDQNLADLAIPKLSCGIDGLDWRVIRSMLEAIFRSSGVRILIWGVMQISSHSKDEISGRNVFKKGQCNEPRPDLSPHTLPSTAMRSSPEIFENHPVALPRKTTVNIGNNWNMPSPTAGIRKIGNPVTEINRSSDFIEMAQMAVQMSKNTKKGRNPGAVDCWLDSIGLYRKNVAYDETCLFRAICEQIFGGQVYHERVRKECIAYARENYEEFAYLGISENDWNNHLEELEKHMVVCGEVELHIISKKYNHDIIIFDASKQKVFDFTKQCLQDTFLLCLLDKDHFDVVYKKEYIINAGLCQSVIYKILYENVFQIPNVDEIVNNMLYDKNIITQSELDKKRMFPEGNHSDASNTEGEIEEIVKGSQGTNVAPFPFKVAKALDPTIYRNIEYDSWGEVRRELRLGDWYYGDNKLILGTKCIFNDVNNEKLECYIQDITKNQNKCVIYLTKLAEKRTVHYSDLSPEDGAKPWPLPYRFMKNLTTCETDDAISPMDHKILPKAKRRNKDKKRTKSESSVMSGAAPMKCDVIENIEDYIGLPALQMPTTNTPNQMVQDHSEVSTTTQTDSVQQHEALLPAQQQEASNPNVYNWEQPQWQPYLTSTSNPFVWPQSPMHTQTPFQFKPMVASAPVTPNVVSYHDQNYPFYYNYHVETYQPYPQWSSPPFELQPPPLPKNEVERTVQMEDQELGQIPHQDTNPQTQCLRKEVNNNCEVNSPGLLAHDKMFTFAPPSPSVEVYPPVMPYPPGMPVLYTPSPADMTEMVMPLTPVMYTEIPHMSPTPYIYPPTPPATWYPTGVTPQGFIFPSRR